MVHDVLSFEKWKYCVKTSDRSFVTYCEDLLLYNMVKYGNQELRHFTDLLNPTAKILLYNHYSDVIFC